MTKQDQSSSFPRESTYQMLVASEEKERTLIEDFVYLLLVIATAVTIFQFGREPVRFADLGQPAVQKVALL
ncbi:MAG TPA: hypothetical protein VGF73_12385 [Chthoniobacterales bacterium]